MFGTISFLTIAISILHSAICSTHESPTLDPSINFQHDHIKIAQAPAEPNHHDFFRNDDNKTSLLLVSSNSSLSRPIGSGESVHTSRSHPGLLVIHHLKHILNLAKTRFSFLMHIASGSGNDILQEYNTTPNLLARHVAITKSPSFLLQPVNNNSTMLGEIILNSNNPLLDALGFFINRIDDFIDSADRVMLNILGEEPDTYVAGLTGNYPLDRDYTLGDGGPQTQTFYRRDRTDNPLLWEIRWDYSNSDRPGAVVGAHVNAAFGGRRAGDRRVRFAYQLRETGRQYFASQEASFDQVVTGLTSLARYFPDTKTWRVGRDMAREDLKQYFRNVARGGDPGRY